MPFRAVNAQSVPMHRVKPAMRTSPWSNGSSRGGANAAPHSTAETAPRKMQAYVGANSGNTGSGIRIQMKMSPIRTGVMGVANVLAGRNKAGNWPNAGHATGAVKAVATTGMPSARSPFPLHPFT